MRNIIWNAQGWKTGMFVGLEEIYSPGLIWKMAAQVSDTPFML